MALVKKKKNKDLYASNGKSPLGVVKTTPQEDSKDWDKWIKTVPGFIEALTENHGEPTSLYDYQYFHLLNPATFKAESKSRQVGMSFCYSVAGLARAHLQYKEDYKAVYISIRQEEANEKILYCRSLYESMPSKYKLKRVVDNKHSLEFEDSTGRYRTRLLSYPQREPRGKGHNVDVFLDELAHYTWGNQIYVAALPVITRGGGTLSVGSSPLGKKGIFFEIIDDIKSFSHFTRQMIPWWICPEFCINVPEAKKLAKHLVTHERVELFANVKMQAIFRTMALEEFQQEYELGFIDENTALIPLEHINHCTYPVIDDEVESLMDDEEAGKLPDYPICQKYKRNFKYYPTVDKLLKGIQEGEVTRNIYIGYDLGRKRDNSEIVIGEKLGKLLIVRCIISLKTYKERAYDNQEKICHDIIKKIRPRRFEFDATGKGEQLAETMKKRYGNVVRKVVLSLKSKERMSTKVQIRLENQLMAIPEDRDLKSQIHSIQKKITDANNVIIQVTKNRKHHGDKFWALACMVDCATKKTDGILPKEDKISVKKTEPNDLNNMKRLTTSVPKVSTNGLVGINRSTGFNVLMEDVGNWIEP